MMVEVVETNVRVECEGREIVVEVCLLACLFTDYLVGSKYHLKASKVVKNQ